MRQPMEATGKIDGAAGLRWIAAFLATLCLAASVAAVGKARVLSFSELASFDYDPETPEETGSVVRGEQAYLKSVVPDRILVHDGAEVEISGYMLPLSIEAGKVDEFILLPNTLACCFGVAPEFNAFVYVKMDGGAQPLDNVPIRVNGTLRIEETWDNGSFSHLYALRAREVKIGFGSAF